MFDHLVSIGKSNLEEPIVWRLGPDVNHFLLALENEAVIDSLDHLGGEGQEVLQVRVIFLGEGHSILAVLRKVAGSPECAHTSKYHMACHLSRYWLYQKITWYQIYSQSMFLGLCLGRNIGLKKNIFCHPSQYYRPLVAFNPNRGWNISGH